MAPFDASARPAGREPASTVHVAEPVPPLTASVAEYGDRACAPGSVDVAIDMPVGATTIVVDADAMRAASYESFACSVAVNVP